jgi:predicted acyl esterase
MRHQTHFRCFRVRPSSVCFSLLLLLSAAILPLRGQTEIRYEVAATKNVMIAMRDGVRLATDIYRPARNGATAEGKFPVLLERTPYSTRSPLPMPPM